MRCVLVDDDPILLQNIQQQLNSFPDLEIIGVYTRGEEALLAIADSEPDIVFLDVELDGIDGLKIAKALRNIPFIVIISHSEDYAVNAFEVNAVDFLKKPVAMSRLVLTIERIFHRKRQETIVNQKPVSKPQEEIYVRSQGKYIRLELKNLLYVESLDDYVKYHNANGKKLLCNGTLKSILEGLPENFIRVHRSYVVNTHAITDFDDSSARLGDIEIPIGRVYRKSLRKALGL